jgi:hypothetical protein
MTSYLLRLLSTLPKESLPASLVMQISLLTKSTLTMFGESSYFSLRTAVCFAPPFHSLSHQILKMPQSVTVPFDMEALLSSLQDGSLPSESTAAAARSFHARISRYACGYFLTGSFVLHFCVPTPLSLLNVEMQTWQLRPSLVVK